MKIAIISVSKKGYELSFKLKKLLDRDSTIIKCDIYYKDVKKTFKLIFNEYDAIIAIMASGILIRSIAPLIKSKSSDPAILNIDDNAKFVISTLSGHLGGANKLCEKIAGLLNATSVITTSTDINNKLGIDVLARDLYLTIDNTDMILPINKAILESKTINFILNPNGNYDYLHDYLKKVTLEMHVSISYSKNVKTNEIQINYADYTINLKTRKIVVGIGCKKNKSEEEIYYGMEKSLNELNINVTRITNLSSGEIKKNEKGILDLSKKLNIPVNFVSLDKLKLFTSKDVKKSDFVYDKFGIWGVCEPSALITAGFESKLIYKKTSYNGVTIAVAVSKN